MKYSVNWTKTNRGNAAQENQIIIITVKGSKLTLFGVFKDGAPVIVGQENDDSISFVLKRKGLKLKGQATLKTTAYNSTWKKSTWKDEFNII
jgi:hypothetical protein